MAQNERQGIEAAGRRGAGEADAGRRTAARRARPQTPPPPVTAQVVHGARTRGESGPGRVSAEGRALPPRELGRLHRILRGEPVRPLPPAERGHGPSLLRKRRARARARSVASVRGSCLTSTSTNATASCVINADLPGVRPEDFRVGIEESGPGARGRAAESSRTRPAVGCVASRGPTAPSAGSCRCPRGASVEAAEARFENGVLEITIPLQQQAAAPGDWRSSPAAPEAPPRGTDRRRPDAALSPSPGRRPLPTVRADQSGGGASTSRDLRHRARRRDLPRRGADPALFPVHRHPPHPGAGAGARGCSSSPGRGAASGSPPPASRCARSPSGSGIRSSPCAEAAEELRDGGAGRGRARRGRASGQHPGQPGARLRSPRPAPRLRLRLEVSGTATLSRRVGGRAAGVRGGLPAPGLARPDLSALLPPADGAPAPEPPSPGPGASDPRTRPRRSQACSSPSTGAPTGKRRRSRSGRRGVQVDCAVEMGGTGALRSAVRDGLGIALVPVEGSGCAPGRASASAP